MKAISIPHSKWYSQNELDFIKNLYSNFNSYLVIEENYFRVFSVKLHVVQRIHLNNYLKKYQSFSKNIDYHLESRIDSAFKWDIPKPFIQ